MPHRPLTLLTGAGFAVFGLLFGVWQVLLADLTGALDLSPGPLGAALSAGVVASLPVMIAAGRLADRVGTRRLAIGAGIVLALAFGAFVFVDRFALLIALLALFLAATGAYDVAINALALDLEERSGRQLLTLFHAAFSGGGVLGALGAGALVESGAPFRLGYLGVAGIIVVVLVTWAVVPGVPHRSGQQAHAAGSLYRDRLLLVLAAVTALSFLCEGAMETWSSIYLRDSLGLAPLYGAAGVAVFHGAMFSGRVATAFVHRRLGRARTLRLSGLTAAGAMLLALLTTQPALVLAGFLGVGLSLAGMAPAAFSLAGEARPGRAGQTSSMITTIGYAGFLLGPALIGNLAELASLRIALITLIVAGVAVSALVRRGARTVAQA